MKGTFAFLKNLDIFGEPVPSFNLGGRTSIKTWLGACVSVQIIIILIAFGIQKLSHLILRKNPIINTNMFPIPENTKYALDQDEFMLAVAAENFDTGEFINDPKYVRWVTAFWEKTDGVTSKTWYLMHPCTEEEFSRFEPPEDEQTGQKVKRMQD